jgi:hypothetical protein
VRDARTRLAAAGFVGGVAAGTLLWTRMQRAHRYDLFSSSRLRRVAALGFLRGRPTLSTARLLREYVAWEPSPMMRQRGAKILRRVEASLN